MSSPIRVGVVALACAWTAIAVGQPVVSGVVGAPVAAVAAGQSLMFQVTAPGAGVAYQWRLDGMNIPGATQPTYALVAGAIDAGRYDVVVSDAGGATTTPAGTLTVTPTDARLMNLSARGMAGGGANAMIVGFVTGGGSGADKTMLIRGIGPGLQGMMGGMMSGALSTPILTVYDNASRPMGMDEGWGNAPMMQTGSGASSVPARLMGASGSMMSSLGASVPATGSADCALLMTAPAGLYTATITGANGTSGVALAECYDADPLGAGTSHLMNMSARAQVAGGNDALIAGFVIGAGPSGSGTTVLVRAMGPALTAFGLRAVLTHPVLTLYDGASRPIATNVGWQSMPMRATGGTASPVAAGIEPATAAMMSGVGAFGPEVGSADCALLATLPPGSYSGVVTAAPGAPATGVCLVEVYEIR